MFIHIFNVYDLQTYVDNIFEWVWAQVFVRLNGFRYCYVSLTIQLIIDHYTQLNDQTVIFLIIQFSTSHLFALLGESEPGSNSNEGLHQMPQSSSITGASPSDCLMSYPGH